MAPLLEGRHTDQHGNSAAIFPEVLVLKWLKRSGRPGSLYQSAVSFAPLRRSEVRPPYAVRDEILMFVSHDAEKGFVGVQNPAVEIPHDDADDVGVDQASDLAFLGAGDGGVKARRFRQQNDQDDRRGEQRNQAACIEAEAEAPADEYGAECHFQNCRQSDDHQPLIEQRAPAKASSISTTSDISQRRSVTIKLATTKCRGML